MTFQEIVEFVFPSGPPENKRFIAKSSVEPDAIEFLPSQVMNTVLFDEHANIWIDLEDIDHDYHDLFD
jgi:hypothetical protein